MSIKHDWQKNMILFFVGVFLGTGYFTYDQLVKKEQQRDNRSFTSKIDLNQNTSKWNTLFRKPASASTNFGKANGLFKVEIKGASYSEEYIQLTGTIVPSQDITQAKITWVLFKGFEVSDGWQSQELYNLRSGEPQEVSITLRKTEAGEAVAHLSVDTQVNGSAIGGEASFSTVSDMGKGAIEKEMKAQENELLKAEGQEKKIFQ